MSCSVIIKDEHGDERRVCVDSEEELKNMTVKEFKTRFCPPEDEWCRYKLYYHEEPEDDQTRGSRCCLFYTHKKPDQTRGDRNRISSDKELKDDQTLGSYGIREGSTILEEGPAVLYCLISGDYDNEVPRTGSMEKVANMQQMESISRSCIIQ